MPRIPTLDAQRSIATGSTGPSAQPGAFGGGQGLATIAQGLEGISRGATAVGMLLEKRKRDKEDSWTTEALLKHNEAMSNFYNNPENNEREDFADALSVSNDATIKDFLADAPSTRAANTFRQKAVGNFQTYHGRAMRVGEANRIDGLREGIRRQENSMLATWRNNARSMPMDEAEALLREDFSAIMEHVDSVFGATPNTHREIETDLTKNYILGAAEEDPDLARDILDASDVFDQEERLAIKSRIDTLENRNISTDASAADRMLKDAIFMGEQTLTPVTAPRFPTPQLQEAAEKKVREHNTMVRMISELSQWNVENANNAMANANKSITDPDEMRGFVRGRQVLDKIHKLQVDDPQRYLRSYNEEVKGLAEQAANAIGDEKAALEDVVKRRTLDLQGFPEDDVPEHEAKKYLKNPESDWNLLSEAEAEQWTKVFMEGSPEQKMIGINQFIEEQKAGQTGPDAERYVDIAYNDLVQMGDLPADYQLAFMIHDRPEVASLMTALSAARKVSQTTGQDAMFRDYKAEMFNDKRWKAYRKTMFMAGPEAVEDLIAQESALAIWAQTLDPVNPASGVDRAIGIVFDDRLGFINVDGQDMMIELRQPDGSMILQEELGVLEDGLSELKAELTLSDVNLEDPLWGSVMPPGFDGANQTDKETLFKVAVRRHGFMRTLPGSDAAELWMVGDNGLTFDLRDKKGRTLTVDFNDYAEEPGKVERVGGMPLGGGIPGKKQPSKLKRKYRWRE